MSTNKRTRNYREKTIEDMKWAFETQMEKTILQYEIKLVQQKIANDIEKKQMLELFEAEKKGILESFEFLKKVKR